MSRPSGETERIESEVPKFPGNFYTARGGRRRLVFPNALLLDGDEMATILNRVGNYEGEALRVDDDESNLYLGPHTPGQFKRRSLPDFLNRSIGPDEQNNQQYGPLQSISDQAGEPFLMTEWCALLNVKQWRVQGNIGPLSFNVTAYAGTWTVYNPDPVTSGGWTTPPDVRAAWATKIVWSDYDEDFGAGNMFVDIGGSVIAPTRIYDAYNESPSRLQPMPRLSIGMNTPGGSILFRTPGAFTNQGEGEIDDNVTWLGRPVRTIVNEDMEDPPDYAVTITAEQFWTSSDPWNGAAGV